MGINKSVILKLMLGNWVKCVDGVIWVILGICNETL